MNNPNLEPDIVYLRDFLCVKQIESKNMKEYTLRIYSIKNKTVSERKIGQKQREYDQHLLSIQACSPITQSWQLSCDDFNEKLYVDMCNRLQVTKH